MKKTVVAIILLLCALVMLLTVPALAAEGDTVYVSDSGSDLATGASADAPLKTLTAAINKLPDTGGTVVLCGDVTISDSVPVFPAKGGKVTVTGEGYGATIKLSCSANMFLQFQSEIEFQHLTFNRTSTSKYAEFTTGPSLTIGEGVTFLENGKAMTKGSNCMMVRLGYSSYVSELNKKCDSASFTMLSGTVNYIQGGNKWNNVGSSAIHMGGTATVTDNIQASGTNFDVESASITLDGVTIPELYLNGYGASSAQTSDIKDVTLTAKNAVIGKLAHQRSDGVYGKATGTVSVTLNNTAVETVDFSVGTIADTASFGLTLSNYDGLTIADDFAEWDTLTLRNSYVYVSSAYAGPASVTVDASSSLVLSKSANTADSVPENGQLERDYTLTLNADGTHTLTYTDSEGTHDIVRTEGELGVVYLDGTAASCGGGATPGNPVNSFAAAYARLKNTGGTIVVTGDVTLAQTYPAFPAKSGKVTVTGLYGGKDYETSLLFEGSANQIVQFKSEIEFNHLTFNRTGSKYVQFATGPSLTFGEGMTMLNKGSALPTGNIFIVRAGNAKWTGYDPGKCASAEFTMLSGTLSYVQGGNGWNHTGTSVINFGGTAKVMDHLQVSGVNGFSVDTVTVNIDGGTIPTLYLCGHAASSVNTSATVNIKNLSGTVVDYQRSNSTGYAKCAMTVNVENSTLASFALSNEPVGGDLSVSLKDTTVSGTFTVGGKGVTGNLSVTLDNASVTSLDGISDTDVTGNVSLTLKNYADYACGNTLSIFDTFTLENSTVQMGVKYEGPASVHVDGSSVLYISGIMNTAEEVPAKVGDGQVIWLNADSFEKGEAILLKYDDRYDMSGKNVLVLDGGTPTSFQVGYGVAAGTKDTAVVTYNSAKGQLIATGIGTAQVLIGDKVHTVTVEPAPISLFLMIGQSNMAGADGDKDQSVITEAGQVYSTFGAQAASWASTYGLNGLQSLSTSTAPNFVASALAGPGSLVNRSGNTTNISVYPLDALSAGGPGKPGMDGGLGYEWTKLTGEKIWMVNAAHGGTSITTWVPSGDNYKQAVAIFKAAQATLADEIAAGHYTLSHMGYFWCQGCADRAQTANWYIENFTDMHEGLKSDLSYDFGGTTGVRTMESGNMILVRACGQDGCNSHSDVKDKEYHTYKDLEMTGVRVAQYYMSNSSEDTFRDVHMVSNLGDSFVYWDDAKTRSNVKEIFEARYPNGLDYTTHVGVLTMPEDEMDVHHTIHYSQLGYNEVGRESARNLVYRLNPQLQPKEEVSIKLYAWDGYTDLAGRTDTEILTEAQTVVPVVYPLYRAKEMTVTGLDHGYYELTGTRPGTVTATLGSTSVTYTLNPTDSLKTFRWELADGTFATVSGEGLTENALQLLTGAVNSDGTLNKAGFRLSESVVLLHDQPWSVEWQGAVCGGKSDGAAFMLLASSASSNTLDAPHIIVSNHSVIISRRLDEGNRSDNYANNYFDHYRCSTAIDLATSHTYALVNKVEADSNMVYLYIDGVEIGALDDHHKGSAAMVESDWLSGKDFVLSHIGAKSAGLSNVTDTSYDDYDHTLVGTLNYLQVAENRLVKTEAKAASCTEDGNLAYYTDPVTGKLYADAQGITEVTLADVTLPAKHSMTHHEATPGDCKTMGTVEYWSCSTCGKNYADKDGNTVLESTEGTIGDHDFTAQNTDAKYLKTVANCHAVAVYHHSCSVCGETGTTTFTHGGVDMTNHDGETELRSAKPAEVGVPGYTGDTWCLGCNTKIADGEEIPAIPAPETSEPETTEPETTEPETTEPETTEPETTEPETTEPETTEPETTEPETTEPETTEPETTEPETTEPETTEPETTEPETTEPETTEPETTEPETTEPETTEPETTEPETTEPETTEPAEVTKITVKVEIPEGWENPAIWAWDNAGNNAFEVWPGLALTKGEDGFWYAAIPAWVENIIINANGGSVQTADLALEYTKVDVHVKVALAADGSVKAEVDYSSPDTADSFHTLWILALLLSALGGAVLVSKRRYL